MFDAIQYVTSGLSLAAFAIAAGAWVYKVKADANKKLIESSPEEKRAELVKIALDREQIDYQRLSRDQQFELARKKISERIERFRISAAVICFMALLLAGISIWRWGGIEPPVMRPASVLPTVTLSIDPAHNVSRGYIENEDVWQPSWVVGRDGQVVLERNAIGEAQYKFYGTELGKYSVHLTVKDGERRTRVSNVVEYELK